jgi:hypothetical protein
MKAFETWWRDEGSAMRPMPDEDVEEFARRIAGIAWSNGAYVERKECAKVCDELAELNRQEPTDSMWQWGECAAAIRARGQL